MADAVQGESTQDELLTATEQLAKAMSLVLKGASLSRAEAAQLRLDLDQLRADLELLRADLELRRDQMDALAKEASGAVIRLRIAGSSLAKRLQAWHRDGLIGGDS